jgi:signal transduction histidine kinase
MSSPDIVERLSKHRTIAGAPRHELEWLAARGSMRHLGPGDLVLASGRPVEDLYIVLSGRLTIFRGTSPQKLWEWPEGDVSGRLPYSRVGASPGDVIADERTDVFVISGDHLPAMMRECNALTTILVHSMLDRARGFTSVDLLDERLRSLGRLSAGLAHELNNPASAIERSASLLGRLIADSERATRALGNAHLTDAQLAALDEVRQSCVSTRKRGVLSPIAQSQREDSIAAWLADNGLDRAAADALAETAVTLEALDRLGSAVRGPALDDSVRWVAATCSARSLASEIQEAAARISRLVTSIKGFTHMDQATVPEPVDVEKGIDDTVTMLRSKARHKSASITVDVEPHLPRARGFAGELNQIWLNLIDNALDAIADSGHVDVRATHERQLVVVRVIDNGSGIPDHIRNRIFEPFATSKPIGQGTGMGLEIAWRLVRHNDGDISVVESRPGRTEFRVEIPAVVAEGGAAS